MDAVVLDSHPDLTSNEMVIWLKDPSTGQVQAYREPFAPSFYVASRQGPQALDRLVDDLSTLPQLTLIRTDKRLGLDHEPSPVLEVQVGAISTFRHMAYTVDRLGGYRAFDLYDVDLRLSHQHLLGRDLFPFAHVRVTGGQPVLADDQRALDYDSPPLAIAHLEGHPAVPDGQVKSHEHPLTGATVGMDDETVELDGSETHVLEALGDTLEDLDPDVLLTPDGDRFLIRYLHHRADQAGVPLRLGRARDPPAPLRKERSYHTYGKIAYQPRVEVLHGRLHIDTGASFFFQEAGVWGRVDLSRITSTPLQELARVGAGTAVTAIQIDRAKREGRVVPWKKNRVEAPKTEHDLVKADRGGFIFDPKVGLFDDVVELDFASMYPGIMVTRNVSPETVLCPCCDPDDEDVIRVPQIGYHTCTRLGFIGRALEPLIERRETYKLWRHERPEDRERYQAAVDAIKWLAVCSFGYQGYRNARFGRIECHEAICAWGREILLTCAEIAREEGFEVIHGIVDSLWLKRTEPWAEPEILARRATEELGIPLEVEGRYDWIVFLPTRAYARGVTPRTQDRDRGLEAAGALNRFYGCFNQPPDAPSRSQAGQDVDHLDRGRLKVRGVELRQASAPGIVVQAQEALLLHLAKATDADGFRDRLPEGLAAVRPVIAQLEAGDVDPADLVITKRVSQPVERYRVMNDTHAALRVLDDAGIQVPPGDHVRYVVLDRSSRVPDRRLTEVRLDPDPDGYDVGFYRELVLRSLESLLLPLGWDQDRLDGFFCRQEETRLTAFV